MLQTVASPPRRMSSHRAARYAQVGTGASTIVHVTAEYIPYVRTGGLGEAVAGLATAQWRAGSHVVVYVPLYAAVRETATGLVPAGPPQTLALGEHAETVQLYRDAMAPAGPEVVFVDAPSYFERPALYGESGSDYPDNDRRFALFSLAALTATARLAGRVGVIHAHDWHAALIPLFLRTDSAFADLARATPTVLSVHNAAFQGQFEPAALADIGLPSSMWTSGTLESSGRLNLLKGALSFADAAVTVSPTHARELVSDLGGFGLDRSFRALGDRLIGIPNGIDQCAWDPTTDPYIPSRYSATDFRGKAICKAALQRELGLAVDANVPVFGMSARLVEQKGLDIVVASDFVRSANAQFVFLGAGEERYHRALSALSRERPFHVAAEFAFTDAGEHRLLAGADYLLMPSLYEPCGLTQMRAQRYGVPVVARRVGGLRDTVDDEVGFVFDAFDARDLSGALARAEACFHEPDTLNAMRRRAMARDFGWDAAVDDYAEAYQRAARHVENGR